mmetsp:Transcript_48763/g.146930  ORF Transcript_48763/g.146930 Transcript_48763/m.146930 type:complete len:123 (-) Transcript_48763:285-653(-)
MDHLRPRHRRALLCCFMHSVRRRDYSQGAAKQVQSVTAQEALDHVSEAIKASVNLPDPRLDGSGKIALEITRQTKGYKKEDPETKHQKALPPSVYRHILRKVLSNLANSKSHLLCGAFFFSS